MKTIFRSITKSCTQRTLSLSTCAIWDHGELFKKTVARSGLILRVPIVSKNFTLKHWFDRAVGHADQHLQCSSQQPMVSLGQFGIRYLKPSGSKSSTEISGSSQTIGEFGIPQMLFVTLSLRSLGNHMLFVILSLRSLGNHITI